MEGNLKFVVIGILFILFGWLEPSIKETIVSNVAQSKVNRSLPDTIEVPAVKQTIAVSLRPDRWSQKVIPPLGVRFIFEGPPETTVRFEADGTTGPIGKNYGISVKWLKGFRFRGPEGQKVTITIVPR